MNEPRRLNVNSARQTGAPQNAAQAGRTVYRAEGQRTIRRTANPPSQRSGSAQQMDTSARQVQQNSRQPAAHPAQSVQGAAARQAQETAGTQRVRQPVQGVRAQQLDLSSAQPSNRLYDMDSDREYESYRRQRTGNGGAQRAGAQAGGRVNRSGSSVYHGSASSGRSTASGGHGSAGGGSGRPPRGGNGAGRGTSGTGKGKNGKKKAKWWKILLATLAAIVLIFGVTIAVILHAIAPEAGSITLNQLINTPKEYAGDYLNVLICGVDWEQTDERTSMYSDSSNDGMTDMIMYVHMDFVENKVYMLQIPRNTLVTSDSSVSGNYQINAVARTQGKDNNNDYGALMNVVNDQWKLPVDGYVSINMQSFKEIVDTLGGVECYVPHDISYGGSKLTQGYQTLTGEMAEFFVRNRKGEGYQNSDLDRLNMQRYFYSGLFRRLKTMTMWDVAKMMPLFVKYCESNLSAADIISLGVSMLKIDSSNMMMCQMPVYLGCPDYNGNSIVAAARQEDADLLNQYFRGQTGTVDASGLGSCFDLVDTSGLTASDANIQVMHALNAEAATAQQNENIDGSNTVTYTDPTPTESPDAGSSSGSSSSDGSSSDSNAA
jgi:LCP family protein required for cell wall assembly